MSGEFDRVARSMPLFTSALAIVAAGVGCQPAAAQAIGTPPKAPHQPDGGDIVITGTRRSAVTDIAPVSTLNSDTIGAIGATSMDELLRVIKPLGESADGEDPIFLLNGQRTSGYQEIKDLPPEAIDKVEVLPEEAALKFGYPPTRRLLNFITKRDFRQIEVRGAVGTTTDPGSITASANLNLTRLHKDSRLTVALESRHTSSLLQSERHVVPDPEVLFDAVGNVTGADYGEIDPALSQAAGEVVTVAPVPTAEADRSNLQAYADAANQPRLSDVGPYRTLVPHNDAWKAQAVYANRLGGTLSGSIDLSAEQSADRWLSGPAAVTLTVPGGNPYSPFASDVLLNRYLTEVAPLHRSATTTTLHGGGTLRGVTAGWRCDLTAVYDRKLVDSTAEEGIDIGPANAAIAAGADPFVPLDPALLSARLTDRGRLLTQTMNSKLVVTNTPIDLPAGEVTVTGTVEAERLSADSVTRGANPFALSLARAQADAGLALDVPLTSRRNDFLAGVGDLSLNGSMYAKRVSGFGALYDRTLGVTWSPLAGMQLLIQDKSSGTAPAMDKLASPIVTVDNATVFDFVTGRTEVVTMTRGGNPNLRAERKHVRSAGLTLKPFASKDITLGATYEDSDAHNEIGDISALTPQFEAIFPDRFVRDSNGRLTAVTFVPTNFYRERQTLLHMTVSVSGNIGPKPQEDSDDSGKAADRPHYYAGAGPTIHFSDLLQLREGAPVLDILRGDTVKGWGVPRVTSYFYGGIGYRGNGVSIDGWYQGAARVRSDLAASDLYFSGIFKLNVGAFVSVHHLLPGDAWTSHTQLRVDVSNVTDAHQHVHDATGALPNRFQPALLDATGRTIKLTLRKLL
jgi:iron complex outermembrane receptor protein